MKIIVENRKARFDYEVIETWEAGLSLQGSEVKSLRKGGGQLKDAFVAFRGHEAYLQKSHIAPYQASSYQNHDPERVRKLLLHREELNKLRAMIEEKGLTCVPLKLYFKNGRVKVEIAIVRGKRKGDKRESIKKRDVSRELERAVRKTRR